VSRFASLLALVVGAYLVIFLGGCGGNDGQTVTSGASSATAEVTLAPDQVAALQARVEAWAALIASVQDTGADKTAEIAAFLWPRADAQTRAAEYQEMWSTGPDSTEVIAWRDFVRVVRVGVSDADSEAVVLVQNKLTGSDGMATDGLEAVTWTQQDGQWYRTTSFWVPNPAQSVRQTLEKTVRVDGLSWSPLSVEEVGQLTVGGDQAGEGRVFLVVIVYVSNSGEDPVKPDGYSLTFYDGSGGRLGAADVFDTLFPGSKAAREVLLDAGMEEQLTYCFVAPEGIDLSTLQYEVK
jgi:hypothetical protein